MKCSRRSSVNFTVRPSARAAIGTSSSSGHGWLIFTPKPPPTSGVITSTWPRSRPSFTATAARTPVELCVEVHTCSRLMSGSQRATVPRPSIGMQALRSMVRSSSSRCGAVAIAAGRVADVLLEPGADVAGHVVVHEVRGGAGGVDADHRRQDLVADPDPADRVLGDVAVLGDDERDRLADVVDLVLGQRVLGAAVGQRRVRDQQRQRLGHRAGEVVVGLDRRARPRRRAPRRRRCRGSGRARAASAARRRAALLAGSTPTSSTYRPWPRRKRWSSTRWTFWPISLVVMRAPSAPSSAARSTALHDVLVAGAAAQVAGDHVAGLLVRGRGVLAQAGGDRGQEARRAEAALQAVALRERLLHRAERAVRLGRAPRPW